MPLPLWWQASHKLDSVVHWRLRCLQATVQGHPTHRRLRSLAFLNCVAHQLPSDASVFACISLHECFCSPYQLFRLPHRDQAPSMPWSRHSWFFSAQGAQVSIRSTFPLHACGAFRLDLHLRCVLSEQAGPGHVTVVPHVLLFLAVKRAMSSWWVLGFVLHKVGRVFQIACGPWQVITIRCFIVVMSLSRYYLGSCYSSNLLWD